MPPEMAAGHGCHVGQPIDLALCAQRLSWPPAADAPDYDRRRAYPLNPSKACAPSLPSSGAFTRRSTRQPPSVRTSSQRLADTRQTSKPDGVLRKNNAVPPRHCPIAVKIYCDGAQQRAERGKYAKQR